MSIRSSSHAPWLIKSLRTLALIAANLCGSTPASAQTVKANPKSGHPRQGVDVSGSGFRRQRGGRCLFRHDRHAEDFEATAALWLRSGVVRLVVPPLPGTAGAITIMRPKTVIGWHRAGGLVALEVARNPGGRPEVDRELRDLIRPNLWRGMCKE